LSVKRPPYNQNAAIRGAIRRTFSRSPVVREVLQSVRREVPKYNKDGSRAKRDSVQYQCQVCLGWVSSTRAAVDHVDPVIHPDKGFENWDTFVNRLFCAKSNLQVICEICHKAKTNRERLHRAIIRDRAILESMSDYSGPDRKTKLAQETKRFTAKRISGYPDDLRSLAESLRREAKGK